MTPKIHWSTPRSTLEERKKKVGRRVERSWVLPQLRAHADMVDPVAFEFFLRETTHLRDFDVMAEAKAKDLAVRTLRDQLAARGVARVQDRAPHGGTDDLDPINGRPGRSVGAIPGRPESS